MSDVAENAVIAKLRDTSGVTDIAGERIEPLHNAQNTTTPRIVVLRPPGQQQTQLNTGLGGVEFTPIIVACVGANYRESRSLSQPVINALCPSNWTGSQTWNSTEIGSCQLDDTFDRSSLPQLADEIGAPVEFVVFMLEHASQAA